MFSLQLPQRLFAIEFMTTLFGVDLNDKDARDFTGTNTDIRSWPFFPVPFDPFRIAGGTPLLAAALRIIFTEIRLLGARRHRKDPIAIAGIGQSGGQAIETSVI